MEDISFSGNFIVLFKDLSSIYISPAENSCDGEGRVMVCTVQRTLKKYCHHGQRGNPASLLMVLNPES